MRVKTSILQGAALDWTVAKVIGVDPTLPHTNAYSTSWAQGGPIVDVYDFTIRKRSKAEEAELLRPDPNFKVKVELWVGDTYFCAFGATVLIAAMRCYVASKLGDEVDIPEELA